MLDIYANQALTLQTAGALDQYGQFSYATSTIMGRIEPGFKLVRDKTGQEVVSSARVYTQTQVSTNDKVDGRLVITSLPQVDLDGVVAFYEVSLV